MTFEDISKKYGAFYIPAFQIIVDGKDIVGQQLMEVPSVTFEDSVDASHRFSFAINDRGFKVLDSNLFEPGKLVELKMGYKGNTPTMIIGEITSLSISYPANGTPQIEVSGYDLFYQFTRNQDNKTWKDKKDSEVVSEIVNSSNVKHKLNPKITDTKVSLSKIVQNGETDYAFIKKLADRNFFELSIKRTDMYFGPPQQNKTPIMTLEYGKSLLSFSSEVNIANQVSEVTVRGWDPKNKKEIVGKAKSAGKAGQSAGKTMEKLYGSVELRVTHMPVQNQQEADTLARAILSNRSSSFVTGNAESIGIPIIRAGATINLKKLGKDRSRDYFIEKSTHTINTSGYKTTFAVRGDIT